jgi:hypothetical protein
LIFSPHLDPFRPRFRFMLHGLAKAGSKTKEKEMKALRKLSAIFALVCSAHACAAGGFADLAVYDRTEGRRLPVYWHEGRAYVAGKPGNEYRVSLQNRLREDVLAVVSVDGINVVSGETADPGQSGFVLSPGGALEIQGLRKSLSQTAAFYFTSLSESYAARIGRPDNVGVIGVALFKRKAPPPAPISQSAPLERADARYRAGAAADSSPQPSAEAQVGTGHGRRETSRAQHVAFARASLAPAETIAIYYDSHRNLVARGVIRESVPVAPLPRPFPGFVPDPAG